MDWFDASDPVSWLLLAALLFPFSFVVPKVLWDWRKERNEERQREREHRNERWAEMEAKEAANLRRLGLTKSGDRVTPEPE